VLQLSIQARLEKLVTHADITNDGQKGQKAKGRECGWTTAGNGQCQKVMVKLNEVLRIVSLGGP